MVRRPHTNLNYGVKGYKGQQHQLWPHHNVANFSKTKRKLGYTAQRRGVKLIASAAH